MHERDLKILRAVVEIYVADGVPVSSKRLREAGGFELSTATLRNAMARLERAGCLTKTHTSSGRVPTDAGYRLYVDHFARRAVPAGDVLRRRCRDALRRVRGGADALLMRASHLLAELSRNVGVAYGAVRPACRVDRVRLMPLDPDRVLVVARLDPEYERTEIVRLERPVSPCVVEAAERWIDDLVRGRTLDDARDALDRALRDNVSDEGHVVGAVAAHRDAIFSEPPSVELYFEERGRMMEQPELADPRALQAMLHLLHDREHLTAILAARARDATQVTIGGEHVDAVLHPFAVVTAGYTLGAARGVLGIIGPTRMRYDVAVHLVEACARELRAIAEQWR